MSTSVLCREFDLGLITAEKLVYWKCPLPKVSLYLVYNALPVLSHYIVTMVNIYWRTEELQTNCNRGQQ